MDSKTIEEKVAKAILQKQEEIKIGKEVFFMAPPSIATLIEASAEISKLPSIKLDSENIASEVLGIAKDCESLGSILAILILGAKNLTTTKITEKKYLFGFIINRMEITIDNKKELAKKILEELSPKEVHSILIQLLQMSQVGDFFGLTTSLIEINLLRQTREVVKQTTASGQ